MTYDAIFETDDKATGVNELFGIVLHHTGSKGKSTKSWWDISRYLSRKDNTYVSAQYVLGYAGQIAKIGNDTDILYHAGWGKHLAINKGKVTNMNKYFIGIEIESDGYIFSDIQYKNTIELCTHLCRTYNIDPRNIVKHSDISGYRGKWDVGPNFFKNKKTPMGTFRAEIFKNLETSFEDELKHISKLFDVMTRKFSNLKKSNSTSQKYEILKSIGKKMFKTHQKINSIPIVM